MSNSFIEDSVSLEAHVRQVVDQHARVIGFKNSLKYIQSSTTMTLERVPTEFVSICRELYLEGIRVGLAEAQKVLTRPTESGKEANKDAKGNLQTEAKAAQTQKLG